jgi:hypothetical protein
MSAIMTPVVNRVLAGLVLLVSAFTSGPGEAQSFCATNFGACPMAGGAPGVPCFCATPNGPIQGVTQMAGAGFPGAAFPRFCCTPAGRLGPYANVTVRAGQPCQAMTPRGPLLGQACF